jgi:hypothetical protein
MSTQEYSSTFIHCKNFKSYIIPTVTHNVSYFIEYMFQPFWSAGSTTQMSLSPEKGQFCSECSHIDAEKTTGLRPCGHNENC